MPSNEVNGVRDSDIRFFDETSQGWINIDEHILDISVSYTMDMCSQITVQVLDPNFLYTVNNFFWPTRTVAYRSRTIAGTMPKVVENADRMEDDRLVQIFEIASYQVSQGTGSSPVYTLEMRTKAIQQMKRDKNPSRFKGSGNAFVESVAAEYGLRVLMEKTDKTQQIQKASGDRVADSTWDVLSSLASDANFVCFETNGILVFASQRFLIGQYGDTHQSIPFVDPFTNTKALRPMNFFPVRWPMNTADTVIAMSMPTIRQSDNDPLEATGSVTVDRTNGVSLRPGMTILLNGMAWNDKPYLIDSVTYEHFGRNPVSVSFRTPEREEKYVKPYDVGRLYSIVDLASAIDWY